jgi:hypothetical protein
MQATGGCRLSPGFAIRVGQSGSNGAWPVLWQDCGIRERMANEGVGPTGRQQSWPYPTNVTPGPVNRLWPELAVSWTCPTGNRT